ECELQIDHDYVAHATLRSLGRGETVQVEFHQLEFGLALLDGRTPGKSRRSDNRLSTKTTSIGKHSPNVSLRSNITANEGYWRAVPGDLLDIWRPDLVDVRSPEIS